MHYSGISSLSLHLGYTRTGWLGVKHQVTYLLPLSLDMEVVKVGGPVYRIGVGGGAASSVQVQGDNKVELDFGAVQRGDAEMEQKLNRVIRACVERGADNPICSIHDQGAGGNGEKSVFLFIYIFFFYCDGFWMWMLWGCYCDKLSNDKCSISVTHFL